jgi:hypothetical protein
MRVTAACARYAPRLLPRVARAALDFDEVRRRARPLTNHRTRSAARTSTPRSSGGVCARAPAHSLSPASAPRLAYTEHHAERQAEGKVIRRWREAPVQAARAVRARGPPCICRRRAVVTRQSRGRRRRRRPSSRVGAPPPCLRRRRRAQPPARARGAALERARRPAPAASRSAAQSRPRAAAAKTAALREAWARWAALSRPRGGRQGESTSRTLVPMALAHCGCDCAARAARGARGESNIYVRV